MLATNFLLTSYGMPSGSTSGSLSYRDVEDLLVPEIYERIGSNLTLVGISTKWWSRSPDAKCTCGVPLTAKARFSKFSFSPNATRSRHCACSANSFVTRGSSTVIVTDKLSEWITI
jgi:hypothetical protein